MGKDGVRGDDHVEREVEEDGGTVRGLGATFGLDPNDRADVGLLELVGEQDGVFCCAELGRSVQSPERLL